MNYDSEMKKLDCGGIIIAEENRRKPKIKDFIAMIVKKVIRHFVFWSTLKKEKLKEPLASKEMHA